MKKPKSSRSLSTDERPQDGRSELLRIPSLFAVEGSAFVDENVEKAMQIARKHLSAKIEMPDDKLRQVIREELSHIANDYFAEKRFREAPKAQEYNDLRDAISIKSEELRILLHDTPSGDIDRIRFEFRRSTQTALKQADRTIRDAPTPHSLESLLEALVAACKSTPAYSAAARGPRARDDLAVLAEGLARLYEELSGKRFNKTLEIAQGTIGSEFVAPGPRFVHAIMQLFDAKATAEHASTALKKLAAKRSTGFSDI